jgi:hypothetical protein
MDWKIILKVILEKQVFEYFKCIELTQYRIQLWVLMMMVISLFVAQEQLKNCQLGDFYTSGYVCH